MNQLTKCNESSNLYNLTILSTGQSSKTVAPAILAPFANELVRPVGSTHPSDFE